MPAPHRCRLPSLGATADLPRLEEPATDFSFALPYPCAAAGGSSEPDNVAEARAWIAAWRARQQK